MIMKKKVHENKELKAEVKPVASKPIKTVTIVGLDLPINEGQEYTTTEKNAKILIEAGAAKLK